MSSSFSPENDQAAEYISKLAEALAKKSTDGRINLRVPNEDFAVAMAAVMKNRGYKATHSSGLLFNVNTGKMTDETLHAVYVSPKRKPKS